MRWLSAGESHGHSLLGILDGMPAGVAVTTDDVRRALARRRAGYGRGARQKFEQDEVRLVGGVRHGLTLGSPIGVSVANSEWPKWEAVMSPDPVEASELLKDAGTGDEREIARNRVLTKPRPGHADAAGMLAYDHCDARNVLERASARETAMRVALGTFAVCYLEQAAGITVASRVVRIGSTEVAGVIGPDDARRLDESEVRCLDPAGEAALKAEIDAARKSGDTLGGVCEVVAWGVPVGLGTYAQHDRRLDARLAGALMSIPSVKSVEIGEGLTQAGLRGSLAHDEIVREGHQLARTSNRAGGIEGGMTNGEPVVAKVYFKPISTVPHALATVDLATGEPARGLHQRSDSCAVVPGAVIAEYVLALELAAALNERFGGYSLGEVRANIEAYVTRVEERLP